MEKVEQDDLPPGQQYPDKSRPNDPPRQRSAYPPAPSGLSSGLRVDQEMLAWVPFPLASFLRSTKRPSNSKFWSILMTSSLLKFPARFTCTFPPAFSGEMVFTSTKSLPSLPSEP